jgi:hypothetical protein
MSWTVACFCGTVYEAPPDRCPACDSHVPDARGGGPLESRPQHPGLTLAHEEPIDFDSLERELAELTRSR